MSSMNPPVITHRNSNTRRKEEGCLNMSPSTSTRWCPTPEQLMILEELYRRGLRTPNASQIQRITAHLAFHGKIQGKNVFYWFQNHKARDRQKLRKILAKQLHQHHQHLLHHHHLYQSQSQSQSLHFHHPSPFHQLSNYFSAHNLIPQGSSSSSSGVSEPWRGDECWMKSYGHDSMMVLEVGPSRSKPLETLELFPLRSDPTTTSTANEEEEEEEDHQESTTSYLDEALPLLIK